LVKRERLETLLAQVKAAMNEPAPVKKDAFGKPYITQQDIRLANILGDTEKVLEELLKN